MVRGFYKLGSGLMTQNKVLSTISNNIANSETTGYKKQMVVTESFEDMVTARVKSLNHNSKTPIGNQVLVRSVSDTASIHSQGAMKETGRNLDVALVGEGFFAVQTDDGIAYTRKGDFNLDEDGYLIQPGAGRIMGQNGPIRVGTDNVSFDANGNVYANENFVDSLAVYNFADYNSLTPVKNGYYTAEGGAQQINANIRAQSLEGSNVDMGEEITNAMAAQRELQTQSRVLRMYDTVLQKATTEIGKIN